jgi:hypothetical protein
MGRGMMQLSGQIGALARLHTRAEDMSTSSGTNQNKKA